MSNQSKDGRCVNSNLFTENANKVPYEELHKYAGQVIAWTLDGTRILVGGTDELDVAAKLKEMGIEVSQVVFDNVPVGDTIL